MNESTTHLIRWLQGENSRLQEDIASLREENEGIRYYVTALEGLHLAAQEIASEDDLLELLDGILYHAMSLVKADDGSVMLLDEGTDELVSAVVHGDIGGELRGHRIGADTGIAGWVAAESEPVIANNPRQDWRFSSQVDELFGFVTRSLICVPMSVGDNLVGVIELLNKHDDGEFSEADVALLSILGNTAAMALETMRERIEAEEAAAAG
ncbi:MAG: GAF domain-containing protein [Anaerolineae bacterium]|nr:GAF domain-containing protein [Anaerolineae bacterium]